MRNNIFKALAHPDRRKILDILRRGPKLAGELAGDFSSSWPTISRHLAVLKDAGLVLAERQGTQILYRINTSVVEDTANILLTLIGPSAKDRDHNTAPDKESALSDKTINFKDDVKYKDAAE